MTSCYCRFLLYPRKLRTREILCYLENLTKPVIDMHIVPGRWDRFAMIEVPGTPAGPLDHACGQEEKFRLSEIWWPV